MVRIDLERNNENDYLQNDCFLIYFAKNNENFQVSRNDKEEFVKKILEYKGNQPFIQICLRGKWQFIHVLFRTINNKVTDKILSIETINLLFDSIYPDISKQIKENKAFIISLNGFKAAEYEEIANQYLPYCWGDYVHAVDHNGCVRSCGTTGNISAMMGAGDYVNSNSGRLIQSLRNKKSN